MFYVFFCRLGRQTCMPIAVYYTICRWALMPLCCCYDLLLLLYWRIHIIKKSPYKCLMQCSLLSLCAFECWHRNQYHFAWWFCTLILWTLSKNEFFRFNCIEIQRNYFCPLKNLCVENAPKCVYKSHEANKWEAKNWMVLVMSHRWHCMAKARSISFSK